MRAGVELDALVAEKVMGWRKRYPNDPQLVWYWADATGLFERAKQTWRPSTSIAAAWDVVERMRQLGWTVSLLNRNRKEDQTEFWYCDFRPHTAIVPQDSLWVDHIPTAPYAICLAALRVVGADVPV